MDGLLNDFMDDFMDDFMVGSRHYRSEIVHDDCELYNLLASYVLSQTWTCVDAGDKIGSSYPKPRNSPGHRPPMPRYTGSGSQRRHACVHRVGARV